MSRRRRQPLHTIRRGIRRIRTLLLLFIAAVIGLSYLGVSEADIGLVAAVFIWLVVATVFSILASALVEAITGDMLKHKYLWSKTVRLGGIRFRLSLSVFAIVSAALALALRYWIMG